MILITRRCLQLARLTIPALALLALSLGVATAASKPVAKVKPKASMAPKPMVPAKPMLPVLDCGRDAFLPVSAVVTPVETTPSGLRFQTIKPGAGDKPAARDYALVGYKGSLVTGAVFDQNERVPFPVSGVVPGFAEALQKMQKGGVYRICIPSALGYGADSPAPAIPANSVLRFEVALLDFATPEQIEASQRQAPSGE